MPAQQRRPSKRRVTGRPASGHEAPPRRPRRGTGSGAAKATQQPSSTGEKRALRASRPQRLQKVLAAAGVGSRRECEDYISVGRVAVDGQVVTELGTSVDPDKQTILLDGEPVKIEPKVYWWLNKPAGVLCTVRDTHGRTIVLDLLPKTNQRVYPVGRLDEESTGLLLLTNDGDLAERLTHPRFGVPKTYHVLVAGRIGREELEKLRQGVWLSEGKVKPHQVVRLRNEGNATRLQIVLREGKNREIRRLLARLGHKVMRLERVAIGPIRIRRLRRGHARPATTEEIRMLRKLASGRSEAEAPVDVDKTAAPRRRKSTRLHRPPKRK